MMEVRSNGGAPIDAATVPWLSSHARHWRTLPVASAMQESAPP